MADHVLVVGNDGFQRGIRAYLMFKGAKVPTAKNVTNIERYVDFLNGLPATELPVGTIYIGSHANEDGWLDIDLDDEFKPEPKNPHTDVKELVHAKTTGSVKLNAATVNAASAVVLRGCRVGQSAAFLTLLKEALGGVTVYAPKFFDDVWWVAKRKGPVQAVVEWFAYGYEIVRRDAFANRAEAVAEFTAKAVTDFKDLSGGAVPPAQWEAWLIGKKSKVWTAPTKSVKDKFPVTLPIVAPVQGKRTFTASVETRHKPHSWKYTITFTKMVNNKQVPDKAVKFATDADVRTEMKSSLATEDDFDVAKSPIPYHLQFGFPTIDAFVDGVKWTQTIGGSKKHILTLKATWHSYLVMPPVVDTIGQLYCNYAVGPTAAAGETPFTSVPFTDAKFFGKA